jgi:hypothetical protein
MVVVDFKSINRTPEVKGPCTVIFYGFPFKTRENQDYRLTFSVTIENGDYQSVIDAFKENGGVWMPNERDEHGAWWMPWPCAAIKVDFEETT